MLPGRHSQSCSSQELAHRTQHIRSVSLLTRLSFLQGRCRPFLHLGGAQHFRRPDAPNNLQYLRSYRRTDEPLERAGSVVLGTCIISRLFYMKKPKVDASRGVAKVCSSPERKQESVVHVL